MKLQRIYGAFMFILSCSAKNVPAEAPVLSFQATEATCRRHELVGTG